MRNILNLYKHLRNYLSSFISHFSSQKGVTSVQSGFTLVEFLLVMSIFSVLAAIGTVNLTSFQRQSQLNSSVNVLMADVKAQQIKAMSGDTAGGPTVENYGISFDPTNFRYILFRGTYSAVNAANFAVSVPQTVEVTSTFPNGQLIFQKGSGEISGYASASAIVTLRDTMTSDRRVLQFNKYGVIANISYD
jgi:prepilin-type N-terminal cleavage/methylation domain-containing protein